MPTDIVYLPHPALSSPHATLVEWLVQLGDPVVPGQPLCLYEVDKAVATVLSPSGGFLRLRLVEAGARVAPGERLGLLADSLEETVDQPQLQGREGEDDFDWSEVDAADGLPQPLDPMRLTISRRMVMSQRNIPDFHLTTSVDMTACQALREELKKRGEKATYNDMLIKSAALALRQHPRVAGVYTPAGFQPRKHLDIGFAAALPNDGLVVPVVRDADHKPLSALAAETRALTLRARQGKLGPGDCSGGVFSVSYLGSSMVEEFAAIINPGETAILAAGRTIPTPVVVDGAIVVRPLIRITLSFDHRSVDGALGAIFTGSVKKLMEAPETLL
jgi:pyruvate dehydrogenase E2 component (dihydrolipoamide acetyltransferase)